MRQNLQLVTVAVRDLAASRAFYSEGLGWRPTLDLEDIVFYQIGPGTLFALWPVGSLAADIGFAMTLSGGFSLSQIVADEREVDTVVETARAAGATVLKEPQQAAFGGYHAYFADPDGHPWEIAYNPGFSVAEDGTVSLVPIG